jgi:hypothetical protein
MSWKNLLNDSEKAEVAQLMGHVRNSLARAVEIVEQAAATNNPEESDLERIAALRRLLAAIDTAFLFPQGPEALGELLEAGERYADKAIGPREGAQPPKARTSDDGEEWEDTLKE